MEEGREIGLSIRENDKEEEEETGRVGRKREEEEKDKIESGEKVAGVTC